jgi:hypothetical protein
MMPTFSVGDHTEKKTVSLHPSTSKHGALISSSAASTSNGLSP